MNDYKIAAQLALEDPIKAVVNAAPRVFWRMMDYAGDDVVFHEQDPETLALFILLLEKAE